MAINTKQSINKTDINTLIFCVIHILLFFLLHIPAHSYKAEAVGYRTCHTTSLLNQQVVNRTVHKFTAINPTYETPTHHCNYITYHVYIRYNTKLEHIHDDKSIMGHS
jgi:hypothetical protein